MSAQQQQQQNLIWAMQSTIEQLTEQVEKVCAANERTEKRLQSLMGCVDNIRVSLMSSVCELFHNSVYTDGHSGTEGTRGGVEGGLHNATVYD